VVTSRELAVLRKPRLSFDTLSGGNMGASQEAFARVGLLDEDPRVRCAEDGEFAYRALRAGVPILYDPEIVVWHHGWRERTERVAQFSAYARSHGAFYGKYLRRGDWFIGVRAVAHFTRALRRWARGLAFGDREVAMIGRAYVVGLLPGILAGMRRRELSVAQDGGSVASPG
jgi:GT2 family glycosyltransferase